MGQHCPSLVWVLCRTGQKGQFHIFLFSFLFSKALEKRCPECPTVVSQRFSRIRKKSVDVYCYFEPFATFYNGNTKKKNLSHIKPKHAILLCGSMAFSTVQHIAALIRSERLMWITPQGFKWTYQPHFESGSFLAPLMSSPMRTHTKSIFFALWIFLNFWQITSNFFKKRKEGGFYGEETKWQWVTETPAVCLVWPECRLYAGLAFWHDNDSPALQMPPRSALQRGQAG